MDLVSQKRNKHRGSLRHTTPGRKTGLRSSAINHALKQIHSRLSHETVYKTEWSKVAELLKLFIPTGGLRVTSDHSSLCFTGASVTWLYKQNSAAKQQRAQSSTSIALPPRWVRMLSVSQSNLTTSWGCAPHTRAGCVRAAEASPITCTTWSPSSTNLSSLLQGCVTRS